MSSFLWVHSIVAEPKLHPSHARLLSFSQRMAQLGHQASSKVLEVETLPAPFGIAQHLGLTEGTPVHKLVRLRLADGQPRMIETAYRPATIAHVRFAVWRHEIVNLRLLSAV